MQKYIDAHCHLQQFANVKKMVDTARRSGVVGFICNATHPDDWSAVLRLTDMYNFVYGCIGVHPWYTSKLPKNWLTDMRRILQNVPNLMIGEVGLDKTYPNLEVQTDVFTWQLNLAYEMKRVIHIHCIGAWDKILFILKKIAGQCPDKIVVHSFTGSSEILEQLLRRSNIYFSLSPVILDRRRKKLGKIIGQIPQNRILVESDNQNPCIVLDIVRAIADIKSVPPDELANIIYKNTLEILNNG